MKDVSAVEMMSLIGRARLAQGKDAMTITDELRSLQPHEVVMEFHRAVASLDSWGILTPRERREFHEYAAEYMRA